MAALWARCTTNPDFLSAATHADGIILRFVTVGKENSLPVNQAEAELISVSEQGEFEVPRRP
jgi:hypothetical protein